MSDSITIALSKPIPNMDLQPIGSVTLVPPTGRHLMKAGPVMRFAGEGTESFVEINPAGMGKLIGACCSLPNSSVEALAAADFMAISTVLMGFLGPQTPSTPGLTPDASGATSTSS